MKQKMTRRGFTQDLNKMSFPKVFIGKLQRLSFSQVYRNGGCVEDPRLQSSGMTTLLNVGQALRNNKTKCHSKLDLESHLVLLCNNEILNQVQDDRRSGFTLIELLVVVLIIGILAAVALPQYQKAVAKSKYKVLMPIVDSVYQAQQAYYLEHGVYNSSDFDELVLDLGGTEHIQANGVPKKYKRDFPWGNCSLASLYIYCREVNVDISYLRYFTGSRVCVAYGSDKTALNHKICQEETGDTQPRGAGNWYYY